MTKNINLVQCAALMGSSQHASFFSPYTNVDFRPITFLRTNLICIRHFQVHKLPVGQADRWSGEVGGKNEEESLSISW